MGGKVEKGTKKKNLTKCTHKLPRHISLINKYNILCILHKCMCFIFNFLKSILGIYCFHRSLKMNVTTIKLVVMKKNKK